MNRFITMLLSATIACASMQISAFAEMAPVMHEIYVSPDGNDEATGSKESPFRTGKLSGNCAVIANHLKDSLNKSDKVLALQRSRYGSNTFGVKVDLKTSFELTPQTKHVSFMVHRPYSGRVMVIGLGKRRDRPWQDADTQQFVAISRADIPQDRWFEVSLPVKGAGGIDVYSIVVVPDCESPHDYVEDKACYIDNIEVKM